MTEQAREPAYRKRVGYHGALLGGFATFAAALLMMGNISTHDAIEQRLAEDLQASLSQVIPATLHDNNLLNNQVTILYQEKPITVYQAIKDKRATALAYRVSSPGYSGEIALIMGINAEGKILGVRVISHTETPGLGDKIEVDKDDWVLGFNGRSFLNLAEDKWKVKKDGGVFDQFSGATITPRAVVKAVHQGLVIFSQHKSELLTVKTSLEKESNTPPASREVKKSAKPDAMQVKK